MGREETAACTEVTTRKRLFIISLDVSPAFVAADRLGSSSTTAAEQQHEQL
jgi:hypothetical protein